MRHYDYVILGAGAAGLSLLMRIIASPALRTKKILLIDKDRKDVNDRTWCFWEASPGFFEKIVFKRWKQLFFHSPDFSSQLQIEPYDYKMIRGKDFYEYCFNEIGRCENIEVVYGEVKSIGIEQRNFRFSVDDTELLGTASIFFNSIPNPATYMHARLRLLQHFKGWVIETRQPKFNPSSAILMDFRVHQDHGTTFAYVLPVSDTRALVEYTLFTPQTLSSQEYDHELREYIRNFLNIHDYSILEEEFGIIPMTNARFEFFAAGMYHIGMAGGQTKPSTGYTFQFIQKQSELIARLLEKGHTPLNITSSPKRFDFYDDVLLRVLLEGNLEGREIFARLFKRNRADRVFKFLDNDSTLTEEVRLITTLQTLPFLKAAIANFNT